MKIGLAQVNPIVGNFNYNYRRIRDYAEKALSRSCDLVVFSEMVVSGYPPHDLLEKNDFVNANLDCLNRMLHDIRGIGVICGIVDHNPAVEGKRLRG